MTERRHLIVVGSTDVETRALRERLGDAYDVLQVDTDAQGQDTARSLTARRQLRESEAAKDDAIARLAGHVAHDLNNWLTVLVAQVSRLKGLPGTSGEVGAALEKALARGRSLSQELTGLVPRCVGGRTRVELDALVDEALAALRASAEGVAVHHVRSTATAVVLGDAARLRSMFDELLSNALRAMPGGGTLSVTGETRTIDAAFAEEHPPLEPGLCAVFAIDDSGGGMDPETLRHLFEPYFATGAGRRASGLGLPTARSTALAHGGVILASSALGRGTHIEVILPLAGPAARADEAARDPLRVLLIDEVADTARPSLDLLTEAGFELAVVDDPFEAIERFRCAPESFDAVMTDPTFGELSAPELVRELRAVRSSVPIIAAPERGVRITAEELLRQGFDSVLVKPWRLDEALAVLGRATTTR